MLVLTVISYNGSPAEHLSAQFDERGGTIGRADNNQMVLPDTERTVSRQHAQISFRNGSYLIVDQGSNPIAVNGREQGKGREQAIAAGDTVQIGGYLLSVTVPQPSRGGHPGDPFADLFGDASQATQIKPQAPQRPSAPTPAPSRGQAVIPDDWDPFGPSSAPSFDPLPQRGAAPAPAAAMPQLTHGAEQSLENLFGLGGPARGGPVRADPLAASHLALGAALPNTAGDHDPLRALQRPAQSSATAAPPIPDDFSMLKAPWQERAVPTPLAPPQATPASAAPAAAPQGAVLSWEPTQAGPGPAPVHAAMPAPAPAFRPPAASAPPRPAPTVSAPASAPAGTAPAPVSADHQALLAAFLEGLETENLKIESLTPSFMFRLGALLRESTRGTVELLAARAALKREVKAQVTMIYARENNPLKFSPTVEIALQHLLGPLEHSFTPPIAAVQDAFDDLRAHQIGMLAGMRAALEGVLQRFDPANLEAKLTPRTGLAGLLSGNRQAKLWESFETLHSQLMREAEDAFHELYGAAFLEAYEAHIAQIKRESPK